MSIKGICMNPFDLAIDARNENMPKIIDYQWLKCHLKLSQLLNQKNLHTKNN